MGVQMTHIMIQDRQTVKKLGFYKYHIKGHTLTPIHVHVSSLSRVLHSPDFAHSYPSRSVLRENHCHGCTKLMMHIMIQDRQ